MSDKYKQHRSSSGSSNSSSPHEQHHHRATTDELLSNSIDETSSIQHQRLSSIMNEEQHDRNTIVDDSSKVSNKSEDLFLHQHHVSRPESNPPKRNQVTPLNLGAMSSSASKPSLVSVRTQKTLNTNFLLKQGSTMNSLRSSKEISLLQKEKSVSSLSTYSKQPEENDMKGDYLTTLEEGTMDTGSRSSYEKNMMGVSSSISSNISYSVVSKKEARKWTLSKILAKIPLSIKLLLIFIFSLACMIVFEGILINYSVLVSFLL